MVAIKLELLLFLNIFYATDGARRIKDGKEVQSDKTYVVYLVKAPTSNRIYDEWLCGGALVSTWFIITSAACVADVKYMYAIAGYKKYVLDSEIETDKCTKEKKKKVVYTCVPTSKWWNQGARLQRLDNGLMYSFGILKWTQTELDALDRSGRWPADRKPDAAPTIIGDEIVPSAKMRGSRFLKCEDPPLPRDYKINYREVEKWSFIDIALVKVESEYDLNDSSFKTLCSYIPTVISINYEPSFQKPGTDALVYGWGHLELWRKPEDNSNYNQPIMRYVAAKILDKPTCKKSYETAANMSGLIDQFMICTLHKGEFNDNGDFVTINPPSPKFMGCKNKQFLNNPVLLNGENVPSPNTAVTNDGCEDDDDTYQDVLIDATRRGDERKIQTYSNSLQHKNNTVFNRTITRKYGICQNDHGGPLVTWVGGNEILIGVASVFRVTQDFKCMGPYLYTSTQCNGAFLDCILSNSDLPDVEGRRAICDSPPVERGYDTIERYISWEHHPSGIADNEKNTNANHKKEKRDLKSPQLLQRLLRFDMLEKMAKNQSTAILR